MFYIAGVLTMSNLYKDNKNSAWRPRHASKRQILFCMPIYNGGNYTCIKI